MNKKIILAALALIALLCALCGCADSQAPQATVATTVNTTSATTEATQPATEATEATQPATEEAGATLTVAPLPDTTMDNLDNATFSVSLAEGDAYLDDEGILQMKLTLYSYDKYDLVDISQLKVGDILQTHSGQVEITSLERDENQLICINGGAEAGGLSLATDDTGIFFEVDMANQKNWYEVAQVTFRVSADFEGVDKSDLEKGEVQIFPGSFLTNEVTNYNFNPRNTTVLVENGQVLGLTRIYLP